MNEKRVKTGVEEETNRKGGNGLGFKIASYQSQCFKKTRLTHKYRIFLRNSKIQSYSSECPTKSHSLKNI
jgi:hypothetical protein